MLKCSVWNTQTSAQVQVSPVKESSGRGQQVWVQKVYKSPHLLHMYVIYVKISTQTEITGHYCSPDCKEHPSTKVQTSGLAKGSGLDICCGTAVQLFPPHRAVCSGPWTGPKQICFVAVWGSIVSLSASLREMSEGCTHPLNGMELNSLQVVSDNRVC